VAELSRSEKEGKRRRRRTRQRRMRRDGHHEEEEARGVVQSVYSATDRALGRDSYDTLLMINKAAHSSENVPFP
jgi:hypothetical protein